jgi:hypothetical protein
MKMRTLLLLIVFILLGAGAWYALRKKANQNTSIVSWDMDFAVKDPAVIHKIFLADRLGRQVTLRREGSKWVVNDKYPVRPTAIKNLLDVISQVVVWYIPPRGTEPMMIQSLATDGIKVELYNQENTLIKTYYVGGVTNDERGTYMMMDGAERPYVTHMPSIVGQLRVRYLMNEEDWRDRAIFSEKPESIAAIHVEYPQMKSESFKLQKTNEATYTVEPFYSTTPPSQLPQRKGAAEAYILRYELLTAEAFENANPIQDSVRMLVPFAIVTVKMTDGREKIARFWPVSIDTDPNTGSSSIFRYFTETNEPSFMLTQSRVFGPIFQGYDSFFENGVRN